MTAPRLSYGVSGARVHAVIEQAARQAGVSLVTFVRPLSSNPFSFLAQLKIAEQPRPGTIVRVNALIAGESFTMPPREARQAGAGDGPVPRPSVLTGAAPTAAPIDREPCWYCGVRGDIGCSCPRPRT